MNKRPRLEAGKVVGEEEHKRIIAELDQARETKYVGYNLSTFFLEREHDTRGRMRQVFVS